MSRHTCPPASALLDFLLNKGDMNELEETETHLASCLLCKADVELLRQQIPSDVAFLDEPVPDVLRQMHQPSKATHVTSIVSRVPTKHQIWAVRAQDGAVRRLILILDESDDPELLTGALISTDTDLASDRDVVFPTRESPLVYSFIIEAWNQFPLLREQCFRYLGSVHSDVSATVLRLGRKGEWRALTGLTIGHNTEDSLDVRRFQLAELNSAKTIAATALKRVTVDVENQLQLPVVRSDKQVEQVSLSPGIPWSRQDETTEFTLYRCDVNLSGEIRVADLSGYFYANYFVLPAVPWDRPCTVIRVAGRDKKLIVRHLGDKLAVRFMGPADEAWGLSPKEASAPTVPLTSGVEREVPVDEADHLWAPVPS